MHDTTPGGQPPADERTRLASPVTVETETVPSPAGPAPSAAPAPFFVGRYRVIEALGGGGFGTVYRARDELLAREVAVKVFLPHHVPSPDDLSAYLAEGRALASLDHPGVVPVYDVGHTDDGLWYLVSKVIGGGDLRRQLQRGRPTHAEAVALVIAVAEALHSAHRHHIIHRDVKPANILLDADGRPYVGDFGQALREEQYGTGAVFTGTPAYMSPEQARGEGHRVDARTDVYSLGVVLYELLAGRPPFRALERADLLDQIKHREPPPPRGQDAAIPRELERICLKCLRKRASERYQTALALADDLRHFEQFLLGPDRTAGGPPAPRAGTVVPRGLRSFDAADADFFLDLLPGPRDRDGLPESVRFWKARLEAADPDESFRVGLLYGPSGCGKSSLVKAGLLPRLGGGVISVYVEATPDDLEARLLSALRRRRPDLPAAAGLVEALTLLRRGRGAAGAKVVLVLDQFEQWLQAHAAGPPGELVAALRQCDGRHVQALLLVRDDFWLAVSRFMRELEVPLVEGRNTGLVDLFDVPHARRVLAEFGRAFGRLPAKVADTTPEQERFLDEAAAGLARDGKVIPVRLSLFAEMTRGKPWEPETLRAVGGTEGIGVLFLEEALGPDSPRPEHRLHQDAARAVLRALLPAKGTNIKGAMRSHEELLTAAGYARRPDEFAALLRILDTELRLITPTEAAVGPAVPDGEKRPAQPDLQGAHATRHYYQLTHDYLVPALREWLTRKQRETRRGRAELRLAERAELWAARPERRHLPSGPEWLSILLFTRRRDWTPPQRRMMRAATRRYALLLTGAVALVLLCARGAWEGYDYQRAATLVRVLRSADTADTPETIRELANHRRWADPMLRRVADEADPDSRERLHAALALLPSDPGQADYLVDRLLRTNPRELPVIRDALRPHAAEVGPRLAAVLDSDTAGPRPRFNAGLALAGLDSPEGIDWPSHARFLVDQFLTTTRADPASYAILAEALRPVRQSLLDPLGTAFRDRGRSEYDRRLTTTLLADYAADRPDVLADLLLDADGEQYPVLLQKLTAFPNRAAAAMRAELARHSEPGAPDRDREALARRQAGAAVTLLHLGQPEPVWPLFIHQADPRLRSQLLYRLHLLGADPRPLAERLPAETNVTARRALVLGLGDYPADALPREVREPLTARLLEWYHDDPDPGIHSAVEWLLRQWKLPCPDDVPASAGPAGGRDWYVNHQGQTFAVIRGPVTVTMGSPPGEPDRSSEAIVRRRIRQSFAVATTPVTRAQYERFLRDRNQPRHNYTQKYCPDPNCPVIGINWFMAAEYCRWLSEKEQVPRDQMCYPPYADIKGDMKLPADYLSRTGYRLLQDAEWEYACRAGAVTSRFYGSAAELLGRYGWYADNSQVRTHPVGGLRPNDFGLFDMHGNIWQWCQERQLASRPWGGLPPPTEDREDTEPVAELHGRMLRGGNFYDQAAFLRCAAWLSNRPYQVDDYFGFRVGRTVR